MDQLEKNKNYCTLYLVRHGETEANLKNITQGHSESPLTKEGVSQAQALAEEFKSIHFDAIFSSDLSRAQKTAEIVKLDRDIIVQTSDLLRERNFGSFEGKASEEFVEKLKNKIEESENLPSDADYWDFRFANDIETDGELVERFISKLREIALAYPSKTVLVVTHGGCIRTFLVKVGHKNRKDLPARSFQNAGHVKVVSDGVDFFIKEVKGILPVKGNE